MASLDGERRPGVSPLGRRAKKSGGRKRGMHPVAISLLTIFAVAAVTYYAFAQQIPFVPQYTLHALVDNSVAVRADSPVRIAGVDVGAVQSTSPAGHSTEINFTLDNTAKPIHRDATIRIRSRLFLEGGYYLELDPGSPSAPTVGNGFTIPQSQTETPVQFYNVLSTFDSAARASLERTLNTLNDGFSFRDSHDRPVSDPGAVGLKNTIPQLTPVLKDTAWISKGLRGTHAGDVETLLASASDVTTTLAGSSAQLGDLVTSLNRASSALASADGALGQSVLGIDRTLQAAPLALTAIDRALPPLTSLATALDPSLKVAPPIVSGLTGAVRELAAIVAPVERGRVLTALKTTFEQFPSLLTKLGSLFPVTKSVTDCLRTHVTPTLQATVPDGGLSSGRPVWQDFVHFLPRIAGASGNFDANGHWVRYLAGAGTNTLSLGTLPVVGQLLATGTPTPSGVTSSIQGSSPAWIGQLTSSAFRPDVDCSTQPLPSFASLGAASDVRSVTRSPAAKALDRSQLRRAVARAEKAILARSGR
jgi:virulence factor Mce-like protein